MSDRLNAYGFTPTTVIVTAFDQTPGKAAQLTSVFDQDRVTFALDWARWEPALVAQHHREWFS